MHERQWGPYPQRQRPPWLELDMAGCSELLSPPQQQVPPPPPPLPPPGVGSQQRQQQAATSQPAAAIAGGSTQGTCREGSGRSKSVPHVRWSSLAEEQSHDSGGCEPATPKVPRSFYQWDEQAPWEEFPEIQEPQQHQTAQAVQQQRQQMQPPQSVKQQQQGQPPQSVQQHQLPSQSSQYQGTWQQTKHVYHPRSKAISAPGPRYPALWWTSPTPTDTEAMEAPPEHPGRQAGPPGVPQAAAYTSAGAVHPSHPPLVCEGDRGRGPARDRTRTPSSTSSARIRTPVAMEVQVVVREVKRLLHGIFMDGQAAQSAAAAAETEFGRLHTSLTSFQPPFEMVLRSCSKEALQGTTPWEKRNLLHVAASARNYSAARLLIRECPELMLQKDLCGWTPLMSLCDFMPKTRDEGAQQEYDDMLQDYMRALFWNAEHSTQEYVESIGWTSFKQSTVFHLTAGKGRPSALNILLHSLERAQRLELLSSETVLNISNHSNKTCYGIALVNRMVQCFGLLEALGATKPPPEDTAQKKKKEFYRSKAQQAGPRDHGRYWHGAGLAGSKGGSWANSWDFPSSYGAQRRPWSGGW